MRINKRLKLKKEAQGENKESQNAQEAEKKKRGKKINKSPLKPPRKRLKKCRNKRLGCF